MPERSTFRRTRIRQQRADGSIKYRQLEIPDPASMEYQKHILSLLHSLNIDMPHATGALPGRRPIDNIRPHRRNNSFYMVDIKDAFPSVEKGVLYDFMNSPEMPARHRPLLLDFLLYHATLPLSPGLPLGAPASPYLFNLYCLPMDREIGAFCDDHSITYTRYLDDLTFSAEKTIGKKRRRHLRGLVEEHPGMIINHAKSRVHNLANGPVTITGQSLYPDRRIGPRPAILERARQVFENAGELAISGASNEHDVAQLHGYNSVLAQADSATPTINRLRQQYQDVVGQLSLAEVLPSGQLLLFQ